MYTSIITALLIAAVFGLIISLTFKKTGPGPGNGLLFFFAIIFMFSWGIGSWITPSHPLHISYPWLSYFFIGLFVMLLLTATLPKSNPKRKDITPNENLENKAKNEQAVAVGFGLFFWIMMISMLVFGLIYWL